jgi:hypothetical protein
MFLAAALVAPCAAARADQATPDPASPPPINGIVPWGKVVWLHRPDGDAMEEVYPRAAMEAHMSARVALECVIDAQGGFGPCVIASRAKGWGFDQAAAALLPKFKVATEIDGQSIVGRKLLFSIAFVVPRS